MRGTPKNLDQAIKNALEAAFDKALFHVVAEEDEIEAARNHIQDFLAQKFSVAYIEAELGKFEPVSGLKKLYKEATK